MLPKEFQDRVLENRTLCEKKDDDKSGRLDFVSPTEKDAEEVNYEVDIKAFNDKKPSH